MFEKIYFKFKLNKNQSLMYQIMIILMEEHKKARLCKDSIGYYDGANTLTFDKKQWEKMKKKILFLLSENYTEFFKNMNDKYIIGLFPEEKDSNCALKIQLTKWENIERESNTSNNSNNKDQEEKIFLKENIFNEEYYIAFIIYNKGYSYQYNGYKKTNDKLMITANRFVMLTFFYYVFSWGIDKKLEIFDFLKKVYFNTFYFLFGDFSISFKFILIYLFLRIIEYFIEKFFK